MDAALPEAGSSPRTLGWWLARPGALAGAIALLLGGIAVVWYLVAPLTLFSVAALGPADG